MYISSDCVFPSDWTAETLMQRHRSRPYNPTIANAFFRAGYMESWGRGIEKICESCEAYGTAMPEYIVHSEDIMVKLSALPNNKEEVPKAPKHQNPEKEGALEGDMVQKLIEIVRSEPSVSQIELAEKLGVTRRVAQRIMTSLKKEGRIERVGGKRYGHWEVRD